MRGRLAWLLLPLLGVALLSPGCGSSKDYEDSVHAVLTASSNCDPALAVCLTATTLDTGNLPAGQVALFQVVLAEPLGAMAPPQSALTVTVAATGGTGPAVWTDSCPTLSTSPAGACVLPAQPGGSNCPAGVGGVGNCVPLPQTLVAEVPTDPTITINQPVTLTAGVGAAGSTAQVTLLAPTPVPTKTVTLPGTTVTVTAPGVPAAAAPAAIAPGAVPAPTANAPATVAPALPIVHPNNGTVPVAAVSKSFRQLGELLAGLALLVLLLVVTVWVLRRRLKRRRGGDRHVEEPAGERRDHRPGGLWRRHAHSSDAPEPGGDPATAVDVLRGGDSVGWDAFR